ncbi:MAG: hypothetical protein LBH20_10430 [Treponema sp.]|jgi:hypothetical protein|nr:hypothetical protein [Treponema sp.]
MNQKFKWCFLGVVLGIGMAFTACDSPMGMGSTVDLEPPVLKITGIMLPDGTETSVEAEDNMLLIGPGILVGTGFTLMGEARDNVRVERITVEEIGPNAEKINGKNPLWDNARIASPARRGDWQKWSIVLDGIEKGERTIRISALDHVKNSGPDSVKQITLLVDTEPPFVKEIKIERQPGLTVGLLPKTKLEELDQNLFENIDYFQNENFTLRAVIEHDFSLADVTLNFLGEDGNELFDKGRERIPGTTVYAPAWFITAAELIAANPIYASGRHYLKVVVTARALAGHSGQYGHTNLLYNLCWYPEADNPHIEVAVSADAETGIFIEKAGSILPVRVFDDDNVGEIYAGMISEDGWANYMPANTDAEKLQSLVNNPGAIPGLQKKPLDAPARNAVVPVDIGDTRGDYCLIVLARDYKGPGKQDDEVWSQKIFPVKVIEEGIPVITIESPNENTAPSLTGGTNFTITGNVLNLEEVSVFRIVWIPAGTGWNVSQQIEKGEEALLNGVPGNGIIIRELELSSRPDKQIGDKWYKVQAFSTTFNIFEDFMYNGVVENEPKFFMFYTQGRGGDDIFASLRLMPYKKPPVIKIESPLNWEPYAPNNNIHFIIDVESEFEAPIDLVTLTSAKDGQDIPLTRGSGENENQWTATTSQSQKDDYPYEITATDRLNNTAQMEIYIQVTTLPELERITSPHNSGAVFSSRDTITIQAVFDGTVSHVFDDTLGIPLPGAKNVPRLKLEGFTPSTTVRYAYYVRGAGTTTLDFEYKVESDDYTGVPGPLTGLQVTAFEPNGGEVNAVEPDIDALNSTNPANNIPATKRLYVNGIAPRITNITLTGEDGDPVYSPWLRAGAIVKAEVAVDKDIRVLGTPALRLQFDNGTPTTRNANFITMNGSRTMIFQYTIQSGDGADPVKCTAASCFSAGDRAMITDTAGANGNELLLDSLATVITGSVYVDAIRPAALNVSYTVNNPSSKTIQIATAAIESDAKRVEYTKDGLNWITITSPYWFVIDDPGHYTVAARQIDRAGNISSDGDKLEFDIGSCNLIAITCDKPDGSYKQGDILTFKLLFSGKVTNAAGTSITIQGTGATNSATNQGAAVNITNFTIISSPASANELTGTYTVGSGKIWRPVTVSAINLAGAKGEDGTMPGGDLPNVMKSYNDSRTGLNVLSIAPSVTAVYGAAPGNQNLAAANNTITIKFDQKVLPENGIITVRPADNWYIPPVLSNEEYAKISNALATSTTNMGYINNNYTETTHGLKISETYYVPDTVTKYVLNFGNNLSDTTTGAVNNARTALNAAKYLWQEVESVDTSQVTGSGTDTITLTLLDKLPNGRNWKVVVAAGAFCDEAGNPSVAFNGNTYNVWSIPTADPVIRVNRVSNNHVTVNPTSNTVTGTKGTTNEVTSRVNVEYRIDCVTPGAAISYGERYQGQSTVSTATTGFGASSTDGPQNSAIADALITDLTGMTATTGYTLGTILTIGDTDLYTARKDYIAATANLASLGGGSGSGRAYEGAFKTVIVYRSPPVGGGKPYIKLEATNTQNGAVTISGFPMDYNDMSGKSSKYAYHHTTNTNDWIWISWEIVSNFWHVGMVMVRDTPNSAFTEPEDPWQPWTGDHYAHNFRKYGNWGLRTYANAAGNGY